MTSIEQLQICGIRSFDPDPSNKQTVYFQKPLTVILGKNGAGKTTIIEALLNACTGSMPPGSGTEKSSFVYDPKVMGESEVKAQIRLIFTGKGGKVMQVIRSFQASRNRNRLTFATLDNTVAFQDTATGKVVSHTYRANDVDRVVPEMLGVSSAVLEHVIFCHQEECNWPLAPPKDVKRIFDDIFAATRYVLALDRLRENNKELRRQQKEHEASLMALREHRDQAQQLEEDITRKEELVKTIQSRNVSIDPELRELRNVSASLDSVEQNVDALTREAAQVQGRMDEKRDAIRRAAIPPCNRTLEEMQEMRSGSAQQVTKAEGDVTQKTQQLEFAQQTTRQREEELYRVRSQLHNMEREDQVHKRNCAELRDALSDISPEYVLSEDSVDERSLSRVMGQAKASAQTAREDMSRAMQQSSDETTALEEKRQNVLRSMDADVKERDMTERMLQAATDRFNEATASIRALGGDIDSRRQLEQAQQEVKKLEARMEAAEELRKKGEHHLRRERITKEFETQNTRVARLRQEMARQKQRSGGQAELAALRKQLEARSADLKNGLQGVIPYITSFFIQVKPDDEFFTILSKISSASQAKKNLLTTTQDELAKLHQKGAALEQRNTTLSEQIVTQTAQLQRALVEAAEMLCRGDDGSKVEECIDTYEETVAAAKEALDAAQQKLHALAAMSACYSGFVEAARGSNHCAVCERPFDDDGEAARFISKHEEHQRTSPQAVEDAKGHIAAAQERLQRLEKARKTVEDVRQLKATLPDLEKSLKDLEKEAKNLEAFSADAASRCRTIENSVLTLNDVLMNMAQLTTVKNDMVELASHISRLEAQQQQEMEAEGSTAASSSKSYEELSEEYEAAIARLHKLNEQLSETQRLEDGAVDHNLGKELLDKRSAMYQLEMSISKINDLQVTLTRCEEEMASHKQRLASIQARRVELQGVLEGLEKSLHKLREARKTSERDASQKVSDAEQKLRVLESSVSRVLDYIRAENGKRLHALREQVKRAEESYNQGSAETATLLREVGEARRVVEESSRRMLEMNRVIEVLQLQRSLDADVARTTDIEKSLQELKGSKVQNVERLLGEHARTESLPRIREMIRGKISELEKMQAQQEGNVEAVLQDVNALKTQLARDKYQNVEKRYRSTFLKVQTTEIAVKDIERYYGALEKAVQSYHQEKIEQINRIISDLWRQTYRGSDIDTVEIRSESETTTASAARRSYSYRVVMKRGNHEIDMRGRCSAGQKVLASVIIRLALSEAFCCDCGILALDEPTTNLDEDNARSLAEALRVLIESRRAVKHFQLIVITHDEQFVRALGGQALDRFYYVRKDREGAFSVIEERTFDQLFA